LRACIITLLRRRVTFSLSISLLYTPVPPIQVVLMVNKTLFFPLALLHCPMILFCIVHKKYKPPSIRMFEQKSMFNKRTSILRPCSTRMRAHTNGLFRPFVSVCCVCFATGGFFFYSLLTLPIILVTKTELSFKLCQEAGERACRGDNEAVCENSLCGKEGFSIYFFFFFAAL